MISFNLRQVTAVLDGPLYQVTNTIESSVGADKSTFVFRVDNKKFSHYASALDLSSWPSNYETAFVLKQKFFRSSILVRTWHSTTAMNEDLAETIRRVQSLANELNAGVTNATIDRTTVIVSQ